jgi:hypothetical protein
MHRALRLPHVRACKVLTHLVIFPAEASDFVIQNMQQKWQTPLDHEQRVAEPLFDMQSFAHKN